MLMLYINAVSCRATYVDVEEHCYRVSVYVANNGSPCFTCLNEAHWLSFAVAIAHCLRGALRAVDSTQNHCFLLGRRTERIPIKLSCLFRKAELDLFYFFWK